MPTESRNTSREYFATTRWTVVLAAGNRPAPSADVALEELCRIYWYPLYAFVRRRGQPPLLQSLSLTINEEIRSRVTYSTLLPRLGPEDTEKFILAQFDRAGLGHNTFTPEALALVVRSSEGLLRRARNLCLSALVEAVRDQTRTVDLKQINRVLIQPHWRKDCDNPIA